MSRSSFFTPSHSLQSKWYNSFASAISTIAKPNAMPGHFLFPAPNAMNSKLFPILIPISRIPSNCPCIDHHNSHYFCQTSIHVYIREREREHTNQKDCFDIVICEFEIS
ncbi:hypothetical protein NC653_035122 [Populus alba x Populus x berolinensis]|uniref:Uncharacterized protein n=1 Tax=Populus alba x Populus x berolinensis TaxID=444605 RepID=A0AAD6PWV7_9ROSI|nr:hypothetical protein NC653_035122 [Populus alba x Populus x berolinensis]